MNFHKQYYCHMDLYKQVCSRQKIRISKLYELGDRSEIYTAQHLLKKYHQFSYEISSYINRYYKVLLTLIFRIINSLRFNLSSV